MPSMPKKIASDDGDGQDEAGLPEGNDSRGADGEVGDAEFAHNQQGLVGFNVEDLLRCELGLSKLSQTGDEKTDACRPEDEPFAEQCGQGKWAPQEEVFHGERGEGQDNRQQ